ANQIQWQVSQGDQRYVALSNVISNHVVRTRSKRETDKRSARRFARRIGGVELLQHLNHVVRLDNYLIILRKIVEQQRARPTLRQGQQASRSGVRTRPLTAPGQAGRTERARS